MIIAINFNGLRNEYLNIIKVCFNNVYVTLGFYTKVNMYLICD